MTAGEARDIRDMCASSADEVLYELVGRVDMALGWICDKEEPVLHHGGCRSSGGAWSCWDNIGFLYSFGLKRQYWGLCVGLSE